MFEAHQPYQPAVTVEISSVANGYLVEFRILPKESETGEIEGYAETPPGMEVIKGVQKMFERTQGAYRAPSVERFVFPAGDVPLMLQEIRSRLAPAPGIPDGI